MMFTDFANWVEVGALRPLDLALTRFIAERAPETDEAVLLAVALTSERNGHGHVCLDLAAALAKPQTLLGRMRDDGETSPTVRRQLRERLQAIGDATAWARRLALSPCVSDQRDGGMPPGLPEVMAATDPHARPVVLAGQADRPLLYLRRYWHYEQRIRQGLEERLRQPLMVDTKALRTQLDLLFTQKQPHSRSEPDWQRLACALASRWAFFIITGGPGTGKTTTVVRLLAVLQALVPAGRPALRIELAAPTGKAAARLNASIAASTSQARPGQVKTLHRLLGTIPGSRHFRHHAAQPLAADLVVVDEASMVDVEMMANLLDALRPDARLILLGDKDQLSSVEAGAVLGDLCQNAAEAHYTPQTAAWLAEATGQQIPQAFIDPAGQARDQAIIMLRDSYRFRAEGGIGALATLVNSPPTVGGKAASRLQAVQALFNNEMARTQMHLGRIEALSIDHPEADSLTDLVCGGYGGTAGYLEQMRHAAPVDGADQGALDAWALKVLEAQQHFQLLTPLRSGPWGVEGLNAWILRTLRSAGFVTDNPGLASGPWFPGRPVLITRNDYGLNLMNGDMGITLAVPATPANSSARLRVAFPSAAGRVRWILPSRLQEVETVFAMTVHKSQGSEFTHTALILPDRSNPVLTRELLYTAITRARERFTLLYGNDAVLAEALQRRVERVSGLRSPSGIRG